MATKASRRLRWLAVAAALLAAVLLLARRGAPRASGFDPVAAARTRLEEVRGEGIDVRRGPCLGLLGTDWVADVAHDPRQPVDDDPANQCEAYRTGKVKHFVELTPEGELIRYR